MAYHHREHLESGSPFLETQQPVGSMLVWESKALGLSDLYGLSFTENPASLLVRQFPFAPNYAGITKTSMSCCWRVILKLTTEPEAGHSTLQFSNPNHPGVGSPRLRMWAKISISSACLLGFTQGSHYEQQVSQPQIRELIRYPQRAQTYPYTTARQHYASLMHIGPRN